MNSKKPDLKLHQGGLSGDRTPSAPSDDLTDMFQVYSYGFRQQDLSDLEPKDIFDRAMEYKAKGEFSDARDLLAMAVERKYIPAYAELGNVYSYTNWGGHDLGKAVHYHCKAAAAGVGSSMYVLSMCYYHPEFGHMPDRTKFFSYLEQAHETGHVGAGMNLGRAYASGAFTFRDYKRASHVFLDVFRRLEGDQYSSVRRSAAYELFNIALFYEHAQSRGMENLDRAVEIYQEIHKANLKACHRLALIHYRGDLGEQSPLLCLHYMLHPGADSETRSRMNQFLAFHAMELAEKLSEDVIRLSRTIPNEELDHILDSLKFNLLVAVGSSSAHYDFVEDCLNTAKEDLEKERIKPTYDKGFDLFWFPSF